MPIPSGWKRDASVFAAGAGCGVLAGAFLVAAVVWQYGNVIGSKSAHEEAPPSAVERWDGGPDPAWRPVAEPKGDGGVVPLSGNPAPGSGTGPAATSSEPAPAPPTIAPPPDSPDELAARDLEIPVQGVTAEKLTPQFDDRRGGGREHEAIDILAPRNTPVVAVEAGRIARLFLSNAGGITIYQFDPSERFCYYYAHLERYADGLREGDMVRKGQVIGYVGTSGNAPADTPHLHFAVFRLNADKRWWEGTALDPYDILTR